MENEGGVKNVDGQMKTANERGRIEREREREKGKVEKKDSKGEHLSSARALQTHNVGEMVFFTSVYFNFILPLDCFILKTLSGKIYQIKTPS